VTSAGNNKDVRPKPTKVARPKGQKLKIPVAVTGIPVIIIEEIVI